jgi:hypothetical protein
MYRRFGTLSRLGLSMIGLIAVILNVSNLQKLNWSSDMLQAATPIINIVLGTTAIYFSLTFRKYVPSRAPVIAYSIVAEFALMDLLLLIYYLSTRKQLELLYIFVGLVVTVWLCMNMRRFTQMLEKS